MVPSLECWQKSPSKLMTSLARKRISCCCGTFRAHEFRTQHVGNRGISMDILQMLSDMLIPIGPQFVIAKTRRKRFRSSRTFKTALRIVAFVFPALLAGTASANPQVDAKKPLAISAAASPQGNTGRAETSECGSDKANPTPVPDKVRLDVADSEYANISITPCVFSSGDTNVVCAGKAMQFKVTDSGLRAKLKQFHTGDYLRVKIVDDTLQDVVGALYSPEGGISAVYRVLALAVCALVILGLATAVTKGAPLKFIVGMDNRYSNSKFQIALWFWILLSTYLATVALRVLYAGWDFFGGVNIPQNLLVLSGLSVLTYGGAKAITTAKVNAAMNPAPVAAAVAPGPAPAAAVVAPPANPDPKNALAPGQERFFRDLVQNDFGGFDFGDFQMLVVTLVAAVMYLMLVFHFLEAINFVKTASLPDVDTTILAGFGLGQGAYLTKKAAGNVGTS